METNKQMEILAKIQCCYDVLEICPIDELRLYVINEIREYLDELEKCIRGEDTLERMIREYFRSNK